MIKLNIVHERFDSLVAVEHSAEQVLAVLDDLGQHQAAAYVAMALDAMRRAHRYESPTD